MQTNVSRPIWWNALASLLRPLNRKQRRARAARRRHSVSFAPTALAPRRLFTVTQTQELPNFSIYDDHFTQGINLDDYFTSDKGDVEYFIQDPPPYWMDISLNGSQLQFTLLEEFQDTEVEIYIGAYDEDAYPNPFEDNEPGLFVITNPGPTQTADDTSIEGGHKKSCTCPSCTCDQEINTKPDLMAGIAQAAATIEGGLRYLFDGGSATSGNLDLRIHIPGMREFAKFSVGGQVGGSSGVTLTDVFFGGSSEARGKTALANFQIAPNALTTGRYEAEIEVTYYFDDESTETYTQTVDYYHVDGSDSVFGAGWRLRDYGQLYIQSDGIFFDFGDGNYAFFEETSPGVFHAPPSPHLHFGAEIVENVDGTYTFDDGHRNLQKFRADGRLLEKIDREGNVTEYVYSDLDSDTIAESLTSIVDPAGRVITLEYASGKLWKATGIDGAVSTFAYDSSGRLVSITEPDPDGGGSLAAPVSEFTYDGTSKRIASITDAEDRTVSYTYDANGYIASVSEIGPTNETITTEYEIFYSSLIPGSGQGTSTSPLDYALASELSAKKIDHDGKVTEYFFNRFGQATRIVHFDGTITESTFSTDGLLLESIDLDPDGTGPLTDRVTTYAYDTNGNVTSITYADDSIETFTYDLDFNEVTSYTDQLDRVTLYERDATTGRITSTTRVMGDVDDSINFETDDAVVAVTYTQSSGGVKGLIETITDAEGNVTKFVYDAYGRVEETIFAFGTSDASSENFEYDTGDRVTAYEDGLGRRTEFVYDGLGRLIETIHPDLSTSDAYDPVSTFYVYNKLGYLIAVTSPVSQNPSNGVVTSRTIETIYEDNFYRVRDRRPDHEGDIDATPTDTVVQYDWLGRPVTSTDELGNVTTYQYDSLRRLQKIVSADPDGGGSQTSSEITYGYNEWGWLVSETDALGKVTNYEYDVMGRVTKILRPELSPGVRAIEEFVYNDAGQLVESIDAMGKSTTYGYDDFGRLVSVTSPDPDGTGGSQTASVVTFEYDENDNLVSETDALGNVTTYEYDAKNRLVKITEADPDGTGGSQSAPETTFVYDDADQLLYTIDAMGRRTDFEYDAWGRLVKTTLPDPDGAGPATRSYRETAYDLAGRVISERDATGAVTSFAYDALDNLKTVTQADPDGAGSQTSPVTQYVYDAAGQLLSKTDPRGAVTTYAYDALGRLTTVTQADPATGATHVTNSPVTSYAYDKNGRLSSITDALGGVTTYAYDAMGRKTSVTQPDPDGAGSQTAPVTSFTYDLAGRLLTETDALGRVTAYAYDALGRVTSVTEPDPDGAGSQTSPVTSFTYDKNGRILTETDALGRVTAYAYDDLGRLVTVTQPDPDGTSGSLTSPVTTYAYDAVGQRTSVTDPLNRVTTYAYNGLGQLSSVTRPDPDGAGGNAAPVTSYTYDAEGRLLTTSEPGAVARITQYEYDQLGRLIEKTDPDPDAAGALTSPLTLYEYDAAGNLTKVTDPINRATTYAYDYLDRQTSVIAPDPDGAGSQAAAVTSYGYDKLGRRTSVTDPRSKTTDYAYDALGRLTTQELPDPDGSGSNGRPTTVYTYDVIGNLLSLTDPEGNVHAYEYDDLDRRITQTDPLLEETLYEYDAMGNVIKKTDRRGLVTEYQYDDLNRRTAEIWKNGSTVVNQIDYTYDEASQLVEVEDAWSKYAYAYDALGRVTSVDNDGTYGTPRTILTNTYGVDLKRKATSASVAGVADFQTNYWYDLLGRTAVIQQVGQTGGNTVATKEIRFSYKADGQLDGVARYAGAAMTKFVIVDYFHYDGAGRLSEIIYQDWNGEQRRHLYTYDVAGRETSHVKTLVKNGVIQPNETVSSTYDDTNQLTGADYSTTQTDESYTYDENGNRVGSGITVVDGNRVTSERGFSYEYDANGNRTKRTIVATGAYLTYTYDHRDRLTELVAYNASGVAQKRVHYYYDAFDRRIGEEVDDASNGTIDRAMAWVYDSEGKLDSNGHPIDDAVLVFDGSGNLIRRYVHGFQADQILAEEDATTGVVTWPLTDKLGTVHDRMRYDAATSQAVWHAHYSYDSFGRIVKQVDGATGLDLATYDAKSYYGAYGPTYGFQGREYEADADLYFHRARWYDYWNGRFVSEDPIFDDTTNTYRYVGNGPTNGRDPSGLQEDLPPGQGGFFDSLGWSWRSMQDTYQGLIMIYVYDLPEEGSQVMEDAYLRGPLGQSEDDPAWCKWGTRGALGVSTAATATAVIVMVKPGPTMSISAGRWPGRAPFPPHFGWRAGGGWWRSMPKDTRWWHSVPPQTGAPFQVRPVSNPGTYGFGRWWNTLDGIPIRDAAAAGRFPGTTQNCFTGAMRAFVNGWRGQPGNGSGVILIPILPDPNNPYGGSGPYDLEDPYPYHLPVTDYPFLSPVLQ